jgi:hypothetical protein
VGFFDEARDSAAREFGRRHYRSYALGAILGRAAPIVGGLIVTAGIVAGAMWVIDAWPSWSTWIPTVIAWAAGLLGIALLIGAGVWIWRNRWRWLW